MPPRMRTPPIENRAREPESIRDEADLVAALRAGGATADRAFETMVREHGPRLLAVAQRIMHDPGDAADVLQDALLQAFRSITSFEGGSKLSTWLHRIVVNAGLMKLRARRSRPELAIDDLQPRFLDDGHHADWPAPWIKGEESSRLEAEETRAMLRDAIAALPERYREIVTLRDVEGRSTEETARLLGESENAVKIRLHRARIALRSILDARMQEGAKRT